MSEQTENYVYLVEIRYRSGHMISEWFSKFEVERNSGHVSYRWRTANPRVQLSHLGPDDVESILIVDTITEDEYVNEII